MMMHSMMNKIVFQKSSDNMNDVLVVVYSFHHSFSSCYGTLQSISKNRNSPSIESLRLKQTIFEMFFLVISSS